MRAMTRARSRRIFDAEAIEGATIIQPTLWRFRTGCGLAVSSRIKFAISVTDDGKSFASRRRTMPTGRARSFQSTSSLTREAGRGVDSRTAPTSDISTTHLAFYAGWPRAANALTVLKNTRESR